jgi:hypothetical protein
MKQLEYHKIQIIVKHMVNNDFCKRTDDSYYS